MATTTNYGWTTPDDTALVKDGASAIRTLGSSVDTTTKNLNPETTLGDLSFRSSTSNVNTRIPIGSSGQHLTVVGGVPAWATASDQTPLTTKGDLLGFSTLDARIPIGANGTLLTADSTETLGLKWAAPAAAAITSANSTVDTEQATTSTSFTDLTTVQTATLTTGTKALVLITAKIRASAQYANVLVGFAVSGATTIAATDSSAMKIVEPYAQEVYTVTMPIYVSTLTAGSNSFTMKFKTSSGTANFADRQITVIDLGS